MKKTNSKLLVCNWKLNGDFELINKILLKFSENPLITSNCSVVILPPFPYLNIFKNYLNSNNKVYDLFNIGAQDVSEFVLGNYTGEVSAGILQNLGTKYCLVGHSERRRLFGENITSIINKVINLLKYDITPIICFGELEKSMPNDEIVSEILEISTYTNVNKLIFAYEPIWAIGSSSAAEPEYIKNYINSINNKLKIKGINLNNKKWLYGGSINHNNAISILHKTEILGLLLGRVSLDIENFFNILQLVNVL